ncbi:MAG: hypothetical protein FRX49_11120 [Trebouxia sp. A1-2]|nr:MAG: hypothetical protein FRX49_11120 [Trebouxia sp. A1-2]
MQTAILHNTQCSGCKHILRRQQASSQSFTRARQPRKDQRTRLLGPQAVSSALALDIGSPSNFQAVTNIVSAVLLGAGAWWYLRSQNNTEGQEVCPKCRGSGVVECFCRKWSDNDVGCGTCGGTGKMVCNSCNGGGTAVPIEARVHIQPSRPINDSYLPRRLQRSSDTKASNHKQHFSQKQHVCKACGQLHCHRHPAVR